MSTSVWIGGLAKVPSFPVRRSLIVLMLSKHLQEKIPRSLTLSITWQEGVLVEEVLSLGVERAVDGDYITNLHQRLHRVMICQVQLFFDTFLRKAGRLGKKKGSTRTKFWVLTNSVFVGRLFKHCSAVNL